MILHPDGRAEGSPEELIRFQELKAGQPAPATVEEFLKLIPLTSKPMPRAPEPYIAPGTPPWLIPTYPAWRPGQITTTGAGDKWPVGCGGITYQGPELMLWNIDVTAAKWPI